MTTKKRPTLDRAAHRHGPAGGRPVGVRERILDAALSILGEFGLRTLTQVHVAHRAGVRQSHLTYYFPTRDDLLNAVTERAVEGITSGFHRVTAGAATGGQRQLLEALAQSVADLAHMRMFVAMIVEADADPAVRQAMRRATGRIEEALAEALGGGDDRERARVILAGIWGLGLYQFLMRPAASASPTRDYLSWLVGASTGPTPIKRPLANKR